MSQAEDFLNGKPGEELIKIAEGIQGNATTRIDRVFQDDSVLIVERTQDGEIKTMITDPENYDGVVHDGTERFDAQGNLYDGEGNRLNEE